jgi:hypothetical protein
MNITIVGINQLADIEIDKVSLDQSSELKLLLIEASRAQAAVASEHQLQHGDAVTQVVAVSPTTLHAGFDLVH